MGTKNVAEIVREYLLANKFDGLVNHHICGGCSCTLSDLIPCEGENLMLCQAAYKHKNLASEGFYPDDQKEERSTGDLAKLLKPTIESKPLVLNNKKKGHENE